MKLELFDGTKTYMFPNGEIATPAKIREKFPAVDAFPHVLELNGNVCQAVMELQALRNIHNVNPEITNEEAIATLNSIINTPPVVEPSPEERIAAALEFQNLMMLPDA